MLVSARQNWACSSCCSQANAQACLCSQKAMGPHNAKGAGDLCRAVPIQVYATEQLTARKSEPGRWASTKSKQAAAAASRPAAPAGAPWLLDWPLAKVRFRWPLGACPTTPVLHAWAARCRYVRKLAAVAGEAALQQRGNGGAQFSTSASVTLASRNLVSHIKCTNERSGMPFIPQLGVPHAERLPSLGEC